MTSASDKYSGENKIEGCDREQLVGSGVYIAKKKPFTGIIVFFKFSYQNFQAYATLKYFYIE